MRCLFLLLLPRLLLSLSLRLLLKLCTKQSNMVDNGRICGHYFYSEET
jgi:hypothetical protein